MVYFMLGCCPYITSRIRLNTDLVVLRDSLFVCSFFFFFLLIVLRDSTDLAVELKHLREMKSQRGLYFDGSHKYICL